MISIKNVHKFFNKGKQNEIHVINDVTLSLPKTGMIAIYGKSGCGKTTLLNVIGGLDSIASGEITVDGQNIKKDTDVLRNKYIGYVFQNYNLNKEISCFDNVADALRLCGITDKAEIESRVTSALAIVDMEKYKKRKPDTLSGGQQQRIAIARAIVKTPEIVLADEPTGNLDEANTVMIMDMLKAISRERLVLIVTHEADLVDHYCDSIVQLADGKIVDIRNNEGADGFKARDKNTIYLGELEKKQSETENAYIEYYGDAPDAPVKIKIINDGGKMYLKLDTPQVQILDESAEVKLCDGVYKERKTISSDGTSFNMSELPPIVGSKYGRLFSFGYSLKNGYESNFKTKKKKSAKLLRRCMGLFAVAIVFMSATFGTSLGTLFDIKEKYNNNVFYVYTPTEEISKKLNEAFENKQYGIDHISLKYDIPSRDEEITFRNVTFETFFALNNRMEVNAVHLDDSICANLPLIAGKNTDLNDTDMVITSKVADKILEQSSLGYIKTYDDLIGLNSNERVGNKVLKISGIVRCDETAVYVSPLSLARLIGSRAGYNIDLAENIGITVEKGSAVLIVENDAVLEQLPNKGDTIKIGGRDIKIAKKIATYAPYQEWLEQNGIKKLSMDEYFRNLLSDEMSSSQIDGISDERYFEYYDYFYNEFDAYLDELYKYSKNVYTWLYFEKDFKEIKYMLSGDTMYAAAVEYKQLNGNYPTLSQSNSSSEFSKRMNKLEQEYNSLRETYASEFYSSVESQTTWFEYKYILNSADYIALSRQSGATHPSVISSVKYDIMEEYAEIEMPIGGSDFDDIKTDATVIPNQIFTVVHTTNVKETEKWLVDNFSDVEIPLNWPGGSVITPDEMFDNLVKDSVTAIISGLISMAVIVAIMSVCMYFIMRSSLMNRIKEIGIYRAIGVSKKNLIFRFFIEALVLTTLTVFIGYAIASAFIAICLGKAALFSTIFFYPVWYAVIILVILYAICTLCGILPIAMLLRKTPSEILAKYDI